MIQHVLPDVTQQEIHPTTNENTLDKKLHLILIKPTNLITSLHEDM